MIAYTGGPYGQKISREEARIKYKNFIKIKQRSIELIEEYLYTDSEACRFYCGRPQAPGLFAYLDTSFVFTKDLLQKMLDKATGDNDGLVIFFGIRTREESTGNTKAGQPEFIDVDGRPTLMIFPYHYNENKETNDATLDVMLDDGSEHPGTGGDDGSGNGGLNISALSNGSYVPAASLSIEIPESIPSPLVIGAIGS